jgi:casein kinase II subunit alpha
MIWGESWHIFKPDNLKPSDEAYPLQVLIKQANFFGPFPVSYQEIADDERLDILTAVMDYVQKNEKRKPFSMAEDPELTKEDREFICRIMKLDPRDRPTARELLQDEWLNST